MSVAGPRPDRTRARRGGTRARRGGTGAGTDLGRTTLLAATLILPLGGLAPLLRQGEGLAGAAATTLMILTTGWLLRRLGLTVARSIVLLIVLVTASGAVLTVGWAAAHGIPPGDAVSALGEDAVATIVSQSYPVRPGAGLAALLVAGSALVAVVGELLVVGARIPAGVALLQIALLLPGILITGVTPWPWVLSSALALLLLLAAAGDGRPEGERTRSRTSPGRLLATLGAATALVLVAGALTSVLPGSRSGTPLAGQGGGSAVSPLIVLGQDLRRGDAVELLEMRSTAEQLPYLWTAVLDEATPTGWREGSDGRRTDADSPVQNPVPGLAAGTPSTPVETEVRITGLRGAALPVPYPAVAVSPAQEGWTWDADALTLGAGAGGVQEGAYAVRSLDVDAAGAGQGAGSTELAPDDESRAVPEDVPPAVVEAARSAVGDADGALEVGRALQDFFRSGDFSYSESAPVAEGYDGDSARMIEAFLAARSGYCVHYASAMALMARLEGVPARIAVGFLPGSEGRESEDGWRVVTSHDAHAWPELYVDGVGWTPFEPTPSTGSSPVAEPSTAATPGAAEETPSAAPSASAAPSSTPAESASARPEDGVPGTEGAAVDPVAIPVALLAVVAALVVVAPASLRLLQRHRRRRRGGAGPAWAELEAVAVDLGLPVGVSDTHSVLAERWDSGPAGPAHAVAVAADAEAFAPRAGGRRSADADAEVWALAAEASRALRRRASLGAVLRARVLPSSLFRRGRTRRAGDVAPPS
ncbi:MAG: transglutaminaseTgpA domain-containing protein [Mycetocola reblochoni]|uniref:transglutaminase family protein n=1 Tax=Mycetocola reblochoni TaxID=331618 RepID=UPI003F94D739